MTLSHRPLAVVRVLCAPLAAAPVPKVKPPVVMLPPAVGTKWEYIRNGDAKRVYVEQVTESSAKDGATSVTVGITTDTGTSRFEKYDLRDGEMRLTESSVRVYDPPMILRKARMKEGDTWTTKHTFNETTWEVTCSVGKAETIKVPAGEFTATPIRRTYDTNPNSEVVYWYADGVGLVKQTTNGKPAQELKSFTVGKGAKK